MVHRDELPPQVPTKALVKKWVRETLKEMGISEDPSKSQHPRNGNRLSAAPREHQNLVHLEQKQEGILSRVYNADGKWYPLINIDNQISTP